MFPYARKKQGSHHVLVTSALWRERQENLWDLFVSKFNPLSEFNV